jgi:peptidoglycan/xylan/chitin deacetylase (PgdA/CDA1 family)
MLRQIKIGLLAAANATRLNHVIGASTWRQRRLLILCYHGVTDGDLNQWNPSLFKHVEDFSRRLSLLREANCNVLGLGEALKRLEDGSLPSRSVVLTFDDGFADFGRVAWPILREFGFPATLYLTTYYMVRNLPVFDPALDYLLWKGREQRLDWPEIIGPRVSLGPAGRHQVSRVVRTHALLKKLTAIQKDGLLEDLANRLGIDYDGVRQSRILSLINEAEARKLSAEGADLQLHTHRHRTPVHQNHFSREIVDNRDCMAALGLRPSEHFGYPNGVRRAKDPQWLEELGIKSAATCDAGFVAADSDRHSLPRVADCHPFTETEFLGWVYGSAALLPNRGKSQHTVAVLEEAETELRARAAAAG